MRAFGAKCLATALMHVDQPLLVDCEFWAGRNTLMCWNWLDSFTECGILGLISLDQSSASS